MPLGSLDSYHEAPDHHLIVDFAMLRTRISKVLSFEGNDLGEIHVDYLRIPILVECKPRPGWAWKDLYNQAGLLFHAFPHQRSIVVVATSGEWWMYTQWNREWVMGKWAGPQGQISDEDIQDDEKKDPTYVSPEGRIQDQVMDIKDDAGYAPNEDVVAPEEDLTIFENSDFAYGAPRKDVIFATLHDTENSLKNS
ncbi:hypothetical protein OBBRIDRAFT_805505 [Obba rivulosa]|uniref:Uncharacterized protein n=1 Tax=Obba rivulosa TaxID=1052685 RepID=A0A8E2ANZ3_9APHY|nr:hypothetical protein OBBRIDRAFT_805505 [Obba rivulosa]